VLGKIGMKREDHCGRRRNWGVFEDVVWMAILRDDCRNLECPPR